MMTFDEPTLAASRRSGPPVRRPFTVEEFHGMASAGFLGPDHTRLELVGGEILELMPIGQRHAAQTNRLTRVFSSLIPAGMMLQVQNPIRVSRVSEPLPDISIVRGSEVDFLKAPPGPEATVLIIEVADTTVEHDTGVKAAVYAAAGIAEYWVINVEARRLRCFRQPEEGEFRQTQMLKPGDTIQPAGLDGLTLAVDDLLLPEGT